MSEIKKWDPARSLELVKKCVSQEMRPGVPLPPDEVDLVNTGLIDSMGWVGILTAIEDATEIQNFGSPWPDDRSQSIRTLVEAIHQSPVVRLSDAPTERTMVRADSNLAVSLIGWGHVLGSLRIDAAAIESECGLTNGTIRDRAGIESVCRADGHQNEWTLGQRAAELALEAANVNPEKVDLLVVTSATFLNFPSLAATLHTRLLLRESCGALDVGGACVGVIYALAAAKALLLASRRDVALVVASEVNSRKLSSPHVPGDFRGLFGDGACAFVLARSDISNKNLRLGDFIWGCAGTSASALQVGLHESGGVEVQFKGEQLAKAALAQLDRIFDGLETLSGQARSTVDYFAIHEPNPRLVQVFAHKAGIPLEKIAQVSKTCGNIGSATCGVSLCEALTKTQKTRTAARPPLIFVAAVGPGLLWGGTYLC